MVEILDKIVARKKEEVAEARELYPVRRLEESSYFKTKPISLCSYLKRRDRIGIIAEIKRRSPSKGEINPSVCVEDLSIGYMQAGASALSVLTDNDFFGGSSADLQCARAFNFCPILRKDFIVDEYQVLEAKSIGADVILLIAKILSPEEVAGFGQLAKSLGMEVLLEIHDENEAESYISDAVHLVGVNNRNLADFSVDLNRSVELAPKIPEKFVKVAESGISSPEAILTLRNAGFDGFLIGEAFMKTGRPQDACRALIASVEELESKS